MEGRALAVGQGDTGQVTDAGLAGSPEDVDIVVDQECMRRVVPQVRLQGFPEAQILFRESEIMGTHHCIQVLVEPRIDQLERKAGPMCVGAQDGASPAGTDGLQEGDGVGAWGYAVTYLVLECDDIETEAGRPEVQAVPVQRALVASEFVHQLGFRVVDAKIPGLCEPLRQVFQPEMVVKVEIEQGAVHVEQHGVDAGPVNHGLVAASETNLIITRKPVQGGRHMGGDVVMELQALLDDVLAVALQAGDAIMAVYRVGEGLDVETKSDDSPLTEADRASHRVILGGLQAILPACPILSEEGDLPPASVRRQWHRYWLVDPLDGTREFISRNGEFTVNIALIEQGVPVLGVVLAPVTGKVWVGARGCGAFTGQSGEALHPARTRHVPDHDIRVVGSRRHGAEALDAIMQRLLPRCPTAGLATLGSSLKFCLLAEGGADLYPRLTPVCEWDVAAAHAVLSAAGGEVYGRGFVPLVYNRGESVIVPEFVAVADVSYDWDALVAFR